VNLFADNMGVIDLVLMVGGCLYAHYSFVAIYAFMKPIMAFLLPSLFLRALEVGEGSFKAKFILPI